MLEDEGWEQVRAGIGLVSWSQLARWDHHKARLVPSTKDAFEKENRKVHPVYGRLICWLTFGVGCEYLVKGICLLKGIDIQKKGKTSILLPPKEGGDVRNWVGNVHAARTSVEERVNTFVELKTLIEKARTIPADVEGQHLVCAGLDLLRGTMRNRDAHRYMRDVRSLQFHTVPCVFVPVLNILLSSLNQTKLQEECSAVPSSDG